ncbi:MAG: ExbD/TolR family protein [Armatimonadota bacterium]
MHSSEPEEDGHIASINIIPLVDVVLVLLIIFMVTTVFARDSALKLDLPQGSRKAQVSQPPVEITVSVDPKGAIFVNGKPTKLEELQTRVEGYKNLERKTVLVLRGDKSVLYGTLMPVLDEISRSGVELTLALEPGKKE